MQNESWGQYTEEEKIALIEEATLSNTLKQNREISKILTEAEEITFSKNDEEQLTESLTNLATYKQTIKKLQILMSKEEEKIKFFEGAKKKKTERLAVIDDILIRFEKANAPSHLNWEDAKLERAIDDLKIASLPSSLHKSILIDWENVRQLEIPTRALKYVKQFSNLYALLNFTSLSLAYDEDKAKVEACIFLGTIFMKTYWQTTRKRMTRIAKKVKWKKTNF